MSEYESLSNWAHEFNRTDEMVRGGFTAVVERKSNANSVKVFWNGEKVSEYEINARSVCVKNEKTEWYLQGKDAERILKKYFSLIYQLRNAAE